MRSKQQRAPRGATLIELMVSLALLAIILSITVGLLVGAIQNGGRARARAALARQGEFVNTLLTNELRMAGLGVPSSTGTHIDAGYGTSPGNETFDTNVILATGTAVGVVGDFPRPDAQYNALGTLDGRPAGARNLIAMYHNENNGTCTPTTISASCNTSTTSFFFPGETGCNTVAKAGDRECPWGMKRVLGNERIQIVSGAMRWTHAGVAAGPAMTSTGAAGLLALNLSTTFNAVWGNTTTSDAPNAVSGQGFVTTIDRVFYNFNVNAKTIERIQCNGDPDPQNANWPNLGNNALPSVANLQLTPAGGVANTCTGPETMAKDVVSVAFTYFDNTGAQIASITATNKAQIRRVDWQIKLQRTVNNRLVTQDVVGSANIRNLS